MSSQPGPRAGLAGADRPARAAVMEEEARELLRRCDGFGGLEAWVAGRRWKAAPGGWTVTSELQGWQFRVHVIPGGLRIRAGEPGGGNPAVWSVTG